MSDRRRTVKLRDYQARVLKQIMAWLNANFSGLLVAPTGAGKTEIIAAFVARLRKPSRVLVLAHLVDLVAQTGERLAYYLPDRSVVTQAASLPGKYQIKGDATKADVVVGTIDTIIAALEYLGTFDVLVIDEAHHAVADTYLKIIAVLRERNPKLRVLGTTATPERSDRKGLDVVFGETPAAVITLPELWGRWLVPPRVPAMPLAVIRGLRDQQGRRNAAGIVRTLNVDVVHEEVIRNWKERGENRQSVFFCCDVEHADGLAAAFREAGIDAESVSYETPIGKRTKMLRKFCEGRGPKVLCNPFLLTEGFDAPPVMLIGLVRPFGNKSTLIQAVGRGLRLNGDGKRDCIVLDFVGAVERHKDLFAGLNLKDRRGGGPGPGPVPWVPTEVGYGEAELRLFPVPGAPDPEATFLRTPEERAAEPEKKRKYVDGKEVISRAEAVARGLSRYFTGCPCPSGHAAERDVASRGCVECGYAAASVRRSHPDWKRGEADKRRTAEFRAAAAAKARAWSQRRRQEDPTFRSQKAAAERMRRVRTPAVAQRERERRADPEYRIRANARRRERRRERLADTKYRALARARQRKVEARLRADPEYRARANARTRAWRARKKAEANKPKDDA